jgi:hypothetical protein
MANLIPLNLPHTSNEDFVYNGYIFPKGAIVFGVLDSVLNDPEVFPEPLQFRPERFLDENGNCLGEQKEKLIPFSIGKHLIYDMITLSKCSCLCTLNISSTNDLTIFVWLFNVLPLIGYSRFS